MDIKIKPGINQKIPETYKNIAQGMERQFLEYMLEKMKETAAPAEEESSADSYYKNLLTSEQAKLMAEKNEGRGIQEMILNQIYRKNKKPSMDNPYAKENL
jgi:Rod binding domain-containing protein